MNNRYKPHLVITPEDDANRQLANGFKKSPIINDRTIQILPVSGGWTKVEDDFQTTQLAEMLAYKDRRVVLLVDFDGQEDRIERILKIIPEDLRPRVYILGVLTNPEELKTSEHHTSYEKMGEKLSEDCPVRISELWNHELLRHNKAELTRLFTDVKSFLFSDN